MYKKILVAFMFSLVLGSITYATVTTCTQDDGTTFLSSAGCSQDELDAANSLASKGIINDHADNPDAYNLLDNVLRQEIAAAARGVADLEIKKTCDGIFDDVKASIPNTWACGSIEPLVENDLISKNTNFRPEEFITKAEAVAMLIKAIGFDYEFDEDSEETDWKVQVVNYAVEKGVVEDFTDYGTLATRGWVFKVANTTIKVEEEEIEEKKEQGTYTDEA